MKTMLLASVFFLCTGFCGPSYAKEISSNFNHNGKNYKSSLALSKLENTKGFDIENTDYKIDISKIVGTAKAVLSKLDAETKWSVETIALYKYQYSNANYWYYQINLRSANSYVYLNVGLNGEEPSIYRIDEILIN